jgi:hypothetical protein
VRREEIAKLTLGRRENKMKLKALVTGVVLATASPFVMAGERWVLTSGVISVFYINSYCKRTSEVSK